VLDKYGRSLPRALMDIYPDFIKDPWFISSLRNKNTNLPSGEAREREFDHVASRQVGKSILAMFEGSSHDLPEVPVNWKDVENQRKFFDLYAAANHFDPLIPDNWYTIPASEFLELESRAFMRYHNFSVGEALVAAYPSVEFHLNKFKSFRRSYRNNKQSRAFFDAIAKKYNFDPLVPESWSQVDKNMVLAQGGGIILALYSDSLPRAVMNAYPELQISPTIFRCERDSESYWTYNENRKLFFDELAKKKNFDPSIPHNWYSISINDVLSEKGGIEVMTYYNFDLTKVLMHLYPHIGLTENLFSASSRKSWSVEVRRAILAHFARSLGFDPSTIRWNSVTRTQLSSHRAANKMVNYCYSGSLDRAIAHLYPPV
jgi:hypothetical protein